MLPRIEKGDGPLDVLQPDHDVPEEGDARAVDELGVHLKRRVAALLREVEQLATKRRRPVELAAVEVEAGEAADDRSALREVAGLLREREGAVVGGLGLLGVAADSEQPPRETRAQRDLLLEAGRRRRNGGEDAEQVVRELDRRVIPAAILIEHPEAVEKRVKPLRLALVDPIPPRNEEVAELGPELVEHGPAFGPVEQMPVAPRELAEVLGMGASRGGGELGLVIESLGCVLPDRLEHRQPALATFIRAAEEAFVDEGGEAIHHVDPAERLKARRDRLDRLKAGGDEDGEQLEDCAFAVLEEVVAPLDHAPERLLAGREVTGAAAEHVEPPVQPVE